ncbi:MAG: hypothetical protein V1859_03135 [archaeon]
MHIEKNDSREVMNGGSYICEADETFFHVCDGQIIKSLYGLTKALAIMSDNTFSCHANSIKNDFSEWIKNAFFEEQLAEKINLAKTREEAKKIIDNFFEEQLVTRKTHDKSAIVSKKASALNKPCIKKTLKMHITELITSLKNTMAAPLLIKYKTYITAFLSKTLHRYPKSNAYHLKKTFIEHCNDSSKKIGALKETGADTSQCESYINLIREKIKELNTSSGETYAIDLIHLFYCLDEEIQAISNKSSLLISSFKKRYEELTKATDYLKTQNKPVERCELYINSLSAKMKSFEETKTERAAIEVLHTFYCLEDALKELKTN